MKNLLLFWLVAPSLLLAATGASSHRKGPGECRRDILRKIAGLERQIKVLKGKLEELPSEDDSLPKRGKPETDVVFNPGFEAVLKAKLAQRKAPTQYELGVDMGYQSGGKIAKMLSGEENFLDRDRYVVLCHVLKIPIEEALSYLNADSQKVFGEYIREKLKGRYVPRPEPR